MNNWFSADYHFFHKNIIKYADRPFDSVEQMDETIIKNHNERVKPDDSVFFLGDFCLGGKNKAKEYLDKLNGNFIFIRGNHDKNNGVKTIINSVGIVIGGIRAFCVHNPENHNNNYKLNLVAHVHDKWKSRLNADGTIMINVGVDVNSFKPVSINEILAEYNFIKRNIK